MPKDTTTTSPLKVSIGQASSAGHKAHNQDFFGALVPDGRVLSLKGITLAIADGISTSDVSRVAAETSVKSLMTDYYSTPDAWTVKTSASRVISATNSWLHAQTGYAGTTDVDRGYVCTLSAIILKARRAHLFHVGDSRIWRIAGKSLEPLTQDHENNGMLSRAMGARHSVQIDHRSIELNVGDVFILTTDGVHGHWAPAEVTKRIATNDLDQAAQHIVDDALKAGSQDNLTVQIVRIDALPHSDDAFGGDLLNLPVPLLPKTGDKIDGYQILRELHGNHRSYIYLAKAPNGQRVALKIPASDTKDDPDALRRFMMEDWIAHRMNSPHVLSAPNETGERSGLYSVTDYIEGQTLRQWMLDNPKPTLEQVRDIIEQAIRGMRSFHRREMLHQDIRPENIMIDQDGIVKLIDFGSTYVAGVQEASPTPDEDGILGTYQYTAPEYFSDETVSWRSDLFSLGVIAYEMLTGYLPYGTQVAKVRRPKDREALHYRSAHNDTDDIAGWLNEALFKAVHPDPAKRYDALSEFSNGLRSPSVQYQKRHARPLAERDPVRFWKTTSALLALTCLGLLISLLQ